MNHLHLLSLVLALLFFSYLRASRLNENGRLEVQRLRLFTQHLLHLAQEKGDAETPIT